MREQEVTRSIKRYLEGIRWKIMSVNYPGAQGGLSISLSKGGGIVPDLVAIQQNILLIVECKPRFSLGDIGKLNEAVSDPLFASQLEAKLALSSPFVLQKAVGAHLVSPKNRLPPDFVLFVVRESGEVEAFRGSNVSIRVVRSLHCEMVWP